jgi:hypothetical protein
LLQPLRKEYDEKQLVSKNNQEGGIGKGDQAMEKNTSRVLQRGNLFDDSLLEKGITWGQVLQQHITFRGLSTMVHNSIVEKY